jgi:putative DNA primase/helicase
MKANLSLAAADGRPVQGGRHTGLQEWLAKAETLTVEDLELFLEDFSQSQPNPITKSQVLVRIKHRLKVPMSDLRRQMQLHERREGPDGGGDHLDLSKEVLEKLGHDHLVSVRSMLYRWDLVGIWRALDDREIKLEIQNHLKTLDVEVTASLVNSILDLLKTEVHLSESPFEKSDDIAINCLNGTLVLVDGEWVLRPFKREDFFTSQIPVHYDKDAVCPVLLGFFRTCFEGDSDADGKAFAVLQMLGYTLLRTCRFEKGILLLGRGANGKSVLLSLVEMLVGAHNIAGVQLVNFDNRFQLGYLKGKLANVVTELPANGAVPDGVLKQIVSGELITAEHKNQAPFDFRPYCTLWVGTNHLPTTHDASDALYRRFLILRFNNQFPENDPRRDPDLKSKLAKELPGILNLALDALTELLKNGGFVVPASSASEARAWRHDQDPVKQFIDTACDVDAGGKVAVETLYSAYKSFVAQEGIDDGISKNNFSRRLQKLGFVRAKGTNGLRQVLGLRVRDEEQK